MIGVCFLFSPHANTAHIKSIEDVADRTIDKRLVKSWQSNLGGTGGLNLDLEKVRKPGQWYPNA